MRSSRSTSRETYQFERHATRLKIFDYSEHFM